MRDPARWAVLVIDVQNKYTMDDSAFRVPDADALVDRVTGFVESARSLGVHIAWVERRPHPELGLGRRTTKLTGGDLSAFHNEELNAIDARLPREPDDLTIRKPRHSAFFATDLEQILRKKGVEGVVIIGVTTNVCCSATAFDAVARDLDVVIGADLTASLPICRDGAEVISADQVQETALAFLGYATGDVELSEEILRAWGG